MQINFPIALEAVLKHEGGFVNHPRDPGGATNKGITQATYDAYRSPNRSVKLIEDWEVQNIYRDKYWNAVRAGELPSGVDYAVFDMAVNSGPSRAIRMLQQALRIQEDGVIGTETMGAVKSADPKTLITEYCRLRLAFLRRLKHYDTFGRGWERRVNAVLLKATKMAQEAPVEAPATTLPDTPTKPASDAPKPSTGLWGVLLSILRAIFGKK